MGTGKQTELRLSPKRSWSRVQRRVRAIVQGATTGLGTRERLLRSFSHDKFLIKELSKNLQRSGSWVWVSGMFSPPRN